MVCKVWNLPHNLSHAVHDMSCHQFSFLRKLFLPFISKSSWHTLQSLLCSPVHPSGRCDLPSECYQFSCSAPLEMTITAVKPHMTFIWHLTVKQDSPAWVKEENFAMWCCKKQSSYPSWHDFAIYSTECTWLNKHSSTLPPQTQATIAWRIPAMQHCDIRNSRAIIFLIRIWYGPTLQNLADSKQLFQYTLIFENRAWNGLLWSTVK